MAKAKKSKRKKAGGEDPNERVVVRNRKARHDYELIEEIEAGVVLHGSEVKAVRNGDVTIDAAFATVKSGELWLRNLDIGEYAEAGRYNHDRTRDRKLLLRKSELRKFAEANEQKGLTLVPIDVHIHRGWVKVKIAVARGRKTHDKRQKLKEKEDDRKLREAKRHFVY